MMKIAVGNDHRGVKAIEEVKAIIAQLNHECVDFSCDSEHPVDYPDVAYKAQRHAKNPPWAISISYQRLFLL